MDFEFKSSVIISLFIMLCDIQPRDLFVFRDPQAYDQVHDLQKDERSNSAVSDGGDDTDELDPQLPADAGDLCVATESRGGETGEAAAAGDSGRGCGNAGGLPGRSAPGGAA